MLSLDKVRVLLLDQDRGRGAIIEQALTDYNRGLEIIRPDLLTSNMIKLVENTRPDVIIIEMDSPDRDTLEHLAIINELNPKPVVIFSENDCCELMEKAIKSGVSAYVVDGLSQGSVRSILEVAITRFREYQALKEELMLTKTELTDRKTIEKAKGILMKNKNLTEEQAYNVMRKEAMNKGVKLISLAENIISVSHLLS